MEEEKEEEEEYYMAAGMEFDGVGCWEVQTGHEGRAGATCDVVATYSRVMTGLLRAWKYCTCSESLGAIGHGDGLWLTRANRSVFKTNTLCYQDRRGISCCMTGYARI